jgi:hypothetical protein
MQIGRSLPPLLRLLRETTSNDVIELAGHDGLNRAQGRRFVLENGGNQTGMAPGLECLPAGEHLVQHSTEGKDVTARVGLDTFELLRSHVLEGAEDRALGRQRMRRGGEPRLGRGIHHGSATPRETEVEQLHVGRTGSSTLARRAWAIVHRLTTAAVDCSTRAVRSSIEQHYVARLQIPVNNACPVRFGQRVSNLNRDMQSMLERKGTSFESSLERLSLEILHHEEVDAVVAANVVEHANMAVVQAGNGARFALESRPLVGGQREVGGEHLDRDGAIEAYIARPIHFSHATGTDRGHDFVRTDPGARGEGHMAGRANYTAGAG